MTTPILSILIPSTSDRDGMLLKLLFDLAKQIEEEEAEDKVEIVTDVDNGEISVGNKRQSLIERAKGRMVVFIDSDDWVADYYIKENLLAAESNPDVIGFNGYMTHDGNKRENFKISKDLPYETILDDNGANEYLRFNNHLSPVKKSIAMQIGYKDLRFGEDYDYAVRLKNSGLISTEVFIPKDMYHYRYSTKLKKY